MTTIPTHIDAKVLGDPDISHEAIAASIFHVAPENVSEWQRKYVKNLRFSHLYSYRSPWQMRPYQEELRKLADNGVVTIPLEMDYSKVERRILTHEATRTGRFSSAQELRGNVPRSGKTVAAATMLANYNLHYLSMYETFAQANHWQTSTGRFTAASRSFATGYGRDYLEETMPVARLTPPPFPLDPLLLVLLALFNRGLWS